MQTRPNLHFDVLMLLIICIIDTLYVSISLNPLLLPDDFAAVFTPDKLLLLLPFLPQLQLLLLPDFLILLFSMIGSFAVII